MDIYKDRQKMNFYTGLSSIKLFEAVYNLQSSYIQRLLYWRGTNRIKSSKVRPITFIQSSQKKLTSRNQFLITLTPLRLGLLNEDLADRFGILTTIFFNILPKENIMENMPKVFRKADHSNIRVIIDCSEVFIERSKSLDVIFNWCIANQICYVFIWLL